MKAKVLIVDDEDAIRQGLCDLFVFHGYEVAEAKDGKTALAQALAGSYDAVILDLMLPEMDGFEVCNRIREIDREVAIIMLTAKSNDEDIINGFTLGADDYVTKPFSVRQLLLRVEAILRRTRAEHLRSGILKLNDEISVNVESLLATTPEGELQLTRREIDILLYLKKHQHRPVSRGELLSEVWGYRKASEIETRTVDIHIAKLRRKMEKDPKNPALLITVRSEGYQLLSQQ